MKNKDLVWWGTFIFVWFIFIGISTILVLDCVPALMISELNIIQKMMMVFGFIVCDYGWALLINKFLFWSRRKIRSVMKV